MGLTGGRNLLTKIGGRDDLFGEGDAIILEKDEFESAGDRLIVIDHAANGSDQLDDLLRHVIAWKRDLITPFHDQTS